MDTIAPTREWQSKFDYEPPQLDRQTARTAYRKISQAERLFQRDDLTYAQFSASEKLLRHTLGAMGVRVQHSDDHSPLNDVTEYPITYHNQKVDEARHAVGNAKLWNDLVSFVSESQTIVEIGTARGRTSHAVAKAYALGRIVTALDIVSDLWGLSTSRKQKIPRTY